ncbi:hypothetical protein CEP88_13050 [Roseobacter denitrificans]|nr:hypothetical protein CEP88_13050 [Roseobacter denitrificans]
MTKHLKHQMSRNTLKSLISGGVRFFRFFACRFASEIWLIHAYPRVAHDVMALSRERRCWVSAVTPASRVGYRHKTIRNSLSCSETRRRSTEHRKLDPGT